MNVSGWSVQYYLKQYTMLFSAGAYLALSRCNNKALAHVPEQ